MKKFTLGFIIGGVICSAITGFAIEYSVTVNPFPIKVDGAAKSIEGYNINDSTYFKLRDIADAVGGFTVGFTNNTITISTQSEPSEPTNTDEPITIHEGEISQRRFAREGDTVIKADGTAVVLAVGPHGILGEGQGVAPDLGLEVPTGGNRRVEAYKVFSGLTDFKESTGKSVINQIYYINKITGEGHWGSEWMAMTSEPTTEGTFEYQLSGDKNWIWMDSEWIQMYVQEPTETDVQTIRDANGLN